MAGSTLNLGLPYPSGPDANDVPYWMQAQAEALDTLLGAAWQSYTPVLTATTTDPSLGSGTNYVQVGRVLKVGRHVQYRGSLRFGASGAVGGAGTYRVSLPYPPRLGSILLGGVGAVVDNSAGDYYGCAWLLQNVEYMEGRVFGSGTLTATSPFTFTTNDWLNWNITYETDS
ncbi:hypothetical protein [Cellulomonas oligotrophica]|uniref:Uncharacterized protein n=1 Tax=Cellulomonas oligotrophica TaxID=931536 RepID=A0A7Y9FJ04_9CELL|nr:hypothetical protein [Cellulomonas oligotrophica]NYD87772.1 hypothetical protein [Cellulomonas oligotrophica]GIG33024.1 hypothetical protein Col01nite_21830 [Cellulomonas oligotrophica]